MKETQEKLIKCITFLRCFKNNSLVTYPGFVPVVVTQYSDKNYQGKWGLL